MTGQSPLRQALANREIRLAETAWMLGIAAEGAFVVGLLVYAYQVGGIVEVGFASLARTLPAGLLAPFIAGKPDDKLITAQWDDVLRLTASVRTGTDAQPAAARSAMLTCEKRKGFLHLRASGSPSHDRFRVGASQRIQRAISEVA